MNIVQEKIDSLNAVLKVQLKPEDYKSQVDTAVRKYSKKVSMPGFRPGMVPINLVRKMYGKAMLAEELNRIVADSIDKYLNDNNIQILGHPMSKAESDIDIDWEKPSDFEFAFEMGMAPEVNITLPPTYTFVTYDIQVSEKTINDEVEKIQKRYGEYITPDVSDIECSIYGKFDELDTNGNILEGGHSNQSFLLFDKISDAEQRQLFIGRKIEDTVDFNPVVALKSSTEIKYLLGLKEEDPQSFNKNFRCTIERINKVVAAELNTTLFDRIYGADAVTNEMEFREKIRAEVAEGYKYESENATKHELEDVMLKESGLNLPDEFLKRWLKRTNEKITDDQLQSEYDQYARDLKWRLIENKIYKDQNMDVSKEEIENYTRTMIMDQYLRYGQAHLLTEDYLKEMTEKYLQNQDSVQRSFESLSSRKVFEYVNQIIIKDVKSVSHEEFIDIMAKHEHHHH